MLPALKVGGRYRAVVERIVSSRRIVIRLGGERLSARIEAPVREGETVIVEVERLLPEVVLRLRRQEMPPVAERISSQTAEREAATDRGDPKEAERNLQQV